ncbi:MAG TPA: aldehyde dehydrogenase family protein, partial [Verrucomicrobiae bacterium]|nr:aldehyde dehydrogenase family protein [Verrucomicrobiae bacterium]
MSARALYLNGQWVHTEATLRVSNPATAEVFAEVCAANRELASKAITGAQAALQTWRQLTGKARGEYLKKMADELERRRDDVART